ncbi:MAG TPA: TonB-dependent receptor [Candidatus Angelobacter sp.]|nr:TonB-dependent receptor [Candidatus Angelobacter sp.]
MTQPCQNGDYLFTRGTLRLVCALLLIVPGFLPGRVWAQSQDLPDITQASLEDLLNTEVTSVSRRAQSAFRSPSAIYVITQEDIRHSTATTVPDLLRGVPGLEVAQINGNQWAITSRGFNGEFNTKMLVMVDGRSVYDPFFSGVYWSIQDFVLEDIARIEIIRGPGGALWGANAVNGVINIITKPADETQGGLVSATAGNQERTSNNLRYGGRLGAGHYRIFSRYYNHADEADAAQPAHDAYNGANGGFRFDTQLSSRDLFSLDGTLMRQQGQDTAIRPVLQAPFNVPVLVGYAFSGGSVNSVWTRKFSQKSDMQLQVWYDQLTKATPLFDERRNTTSLDFQHHFALDSRQDIVWGMAYRYFSDNASAPPDSGISFLAPLRTHLWSLFVQDDIQVLRERLTLTLGSKFEHNQFTGWEVQPNARLTYTPTRKQTFWAAVSRGARTPAGREVSMQSDDAAFLTPSGLPAVVRELANPHLEAERMIGYELGYRVQIGKTASLDVAAFYNRYLDLASNEPQTPFLAGPPLHLVVPLMPDNQFFAKSVGSEISATWKPTERWGWKAGYSHIAISAGREAGSADTSFLTIAGNSPRNQASLNSWFDFTRSLQGSISSRFVDRLTALSVPGYTEVNSKITWQPRQNWSFTLAGENLLHAHHLEFNDPVLSSTAVRRSVYGKVEWHF